MLQKLHSAHLGAESSIFFAHLHEQRRVLLAWNEIRDPRSLPGLWKMCTIQRIPPKYPWQSISQNIVTFDSTNYRITVDHYSDFIEVDELYNTLSSTITVKTEAHLARHGIPEVILTDNGPQFIAKDYGHLCHRYAEPVHLTGLKATAKQRQSSKS